jgi:transcription initiation factor TFIID subunit TAF12
LSCILGFDPRHHLANFPILNNSQPQQQQNDANVMLHNAKQHTQQQVHHTKIKQQRSSSSNSINQQQQQQQQQQQSQQSAPHLLTTIAFPGNPLQQHAQQQHLQPQTNHQQHSHTILIPASSAATQVRNNTTNIATTFNNASTLNNWPCPACKVGFKSASELQAHLR